MDRFQYYSGVIDDFEAQRQDGTLDRSRCREELEEIDRIHRRGLLSRPEFKALRDAMRLVMAEEPVGHTPMGIEFRIEEE